MKHPIKLLTLSLLALAFPVRRDFCTANAKKTSTAKTETPPPPSNGAKPPKTEIELLCEAEGVDPRNVIWRIQPGLTAKQAIEIAKQNKLEGLE